jgi:hypothetical protein
VLGHPQWTRHRPPRPGRVGGGRPPGAEGPACQRPQGKQIPPSAGAPTIAYGPSPCRAFAWLSIAPTSSAIPPREPCLCIVATADRHGRAAEAHPFVEVVMAQPGRAPWQPGRVPRRPDPGGIRDMRRLAG